MTVALGALLTIVSSRYAREVSEALVESASRSRMKMV
jgi:hypothetical protein